MAQWRSHVESAADLTLEQHIVAPQMNLRWLTRGFQLLQVAVAEFVLFIPLVADGLSVGNSLRNRRPRRRCLRFGAGLNFCGVCRHSSRTLIVDSCNQDIEDRSEEHTSELQSRRDLVCRLLLEKKKEKILPSQISKRKKQRR